MKRYVLSGIVLVLILLVAGLIVKSVFLKPANAGLKVDSIPAASVFLEGKDLGKTPFEQEKLATGEKTLKLVPQSTTGNFYPWETKIKLNSETMTVVRREFGETEGQSAGDIITLEKITDKKTASLSVVSIPDSSLVKLNGESKGFTPFSKDQLSEGEAEVVVSAPGFKERAVRTKLVAGYKTIINVKLAENLEASQGATPSATPAPTGKVTPKPSPKPTIKPTGGPVSPTQGGPTPTNPPKPYIEINQTPTGWLRVRMEPSTTATEAAKVYPGDKYSLLDEKSGWYKISYEKDKSGWVSAEYAQKFD